MTVRQSPPLTRASVAAAEHSREEAKRERMREARFWRSLTTTEHTTIGLRFIVTAFAFFAIAGLLALTMRLQLAKPQSTLVGPDLYNQIFTTHGTTMMFLFAVPVMQGLGLYFVPLMVGARNLAFPRLAAYSYWMFLFGGIFLYVAFFTNTGPDAGWFAYTPLSGPEHSPGKRVDVWAQLITFTEISGLGAAVNVIVTALKHRAPGMSLDRMPIFTWASVVTAFMVVFALPAVVTASTLLALDRLVGTQFFNPAEGGDPLLWQHMFWFFGHPEVYMIFLPAMGIMSELVLSAARRQVFGYTAIVVANVATALFAFGLWVHHMFATGIPHLGSSFFTAASILIALPTGVQLFCWIATLWGSKPRIDTAFWFIASFFSTFLIGGLTGVMLGSVPIDIQVHDTFFVVAHLHYVLIGGAVFPLLGGICHWFPKFTGRLLDERLGKLGAALVFVGFHLTFFPMHWLGLRGMPRRIYTYLPESGWSMWNLVATVGAFVLGLGVLVMVVNVLKSLRSGALAGPNPWKADSLEWAHPSPPPASFERVTPVVPSRYPLWVGELGRVVGLEKDELLVTSIVDAEPDHKVRMHGPALAPIVAAIATTAMIVACLFTPWGLPAGMAVLFGVAVGWFWPEAPAPEDRMPEEAQP